MSTWWGRVAQVILSLLKIFYEATDFLSLLLENASCLPYCLMFVLKDQFCWRRQCQNVRLSLVLIATDWICWYQNSGGMAGNCPIHWFIWQLSFFWSHDSCSPYAKLRLRSLTFKSHTWAIITRVTTLFFRNTEVQLTFPPSSLLSVIWFTSMSQLRTGALLFAIKTRAYNTAIKHNIVITVHIFELLSACFASTLCENAQNLARKQPKVCAMSTKCREV